MSKSTVQSTTRIAIIGCGNIGTAIARGLVKSGQYSPGQITLTRRQSRPLEELTSAGYNCTTDNIKAVRDNQIILLTVLPQQIHAVLDETGGELTADMTVISVVSGITINELTGLLPHPVPVVRAMPNTAIEFGESITCLAAASGNEDALGLAHSLFQAAGSTLEISEELMTPATALGACGVAFFLRFIRAASQGGIEIGFHPHEALQIAAQAASGAAAIMLDSEAHPEAAIDQVTTPRGATIAGLNTMEHEGLSSSIIKGIVASEQKIGQLLSSRD